ncbi:hypothetical protein PXK00_05560 [Phaeobacter sp. QD34_3]|uniref:hypothetical protein n=1 Tax=unclassified Phaeobacter TaxID=2621772 RepID=UPI00237F21F6|nr:MULTISPECIES: hypothetical protein [unclassified Phaeobacter]MDE4132565.1 hypothetical protein [Phaeobacter sp. QD34_3]MDE4136202.1 hypothetical protein [Phaeobacter sp. QD34_24]MDE4174436.1 hypothetical protein [Phaeobacter sp. PT47_59]
MLTDIYARAMITATRQNTICLREMPAAARPLPVPKTGLGRLKARLKRLSRRPAGQIRCIDPQNI